MTYLKEHWVAIRMLVSLMVVGVWGANLQEGLKMLSDWWQTGQYSLGQFVLGYSFMLGPFILGIIGLTKSILAIRKSKDKSALFFPLMKDPTRIHKEQEQKDLADIKKMYEKNKEDGLV